MSKEKIHGALPDPSEKELTVKTMFDRIAPRYDIMNRLITFGLDVIWRRKTVEELKPTPGGRILDGEGMGWIRMLPLLPLSTCAAVQNRMDTICVFRGVAHGRRL